MSAISQLETRTQPGDVFSAWASVYDRQENPLLMLEERYLSRILPRIDGRDVLDVGCGTGRWLAQFSQSSRPQSLHGVDPSPEMLAQAAAKHIPELQLSLAGSANLPFKDSTMDVMLASFVLSYEDDLGKAAAEFARVARPGCDVFISDMHPETATSLCWKRSFHIGESELELPAKCWALSEILNVFKAAGFSERAVIEPAFGSPEKDLFASHNRLERFAEAEGLPAIYLLHLTKLEADNNRSLVPGEEKDRLLLSGARCALGPREVIATSITTNNGSVEIVSSHPPTIASQTITSIDLTGYLIFPGLINAHDHLEFALFPRLGRGGYKNAAQWAQDIQRSDAEIIAVHRRIPKRTRLWWGGIRNLLSGVTTVCHHNPIDPSLLAQDFPVHIVSDLGWEHSLAFATDIQAAHSSSGEDRPFVIHACEGIDDQSNEELVSLDTLGVLDQKTVLIHGLALDVRAADLLNSRGTSLIVCPSSNDFLFGKTPRLEVLNSVERLALGSDSPLTAAGDLLDEIRFAYETCKLPAQKLFAMVTDSSASILRIKDGRGSIRSGSPADLIAVRDRQGSPAEILSSLCASDIELVLLSGRVQLASQFIFGRLPDVDRDGLEPLSVDGDIRWLRAPIEDLLRESESVLGEGAVRLGGKSVCRPS
ncbi:methyltransferase domain-containing protein [Alloacidobacterium dinghuense]|uniref:Methyltransferase domain-containing protein n=1 Tax=Alloacidobacterium dinghuense TaxID=2763107 RepID=A0A7G8BMI9_9BACT|nr:methyltransferase domain-containing protein [Alloacidobacterium dinghuense]QNI33759.1 methyltransferase domain-containing protein [Alloacidobacterium dinghuense]